tara:strand:- start:52 stop:1212 length:1161 start_codon:yes stop_codon:yes gene_type:complete
MLKLGQILISLIALGLPLLSMPVNAAWFEATGQAVIVDGNKALAKKQATQEAIKQALMFAGASITSIQAVSNGLLQNDRFEIRSGGEVNDLELVNESYHDNYVTVVIRADIFAQESQCKAAQYKKRVVSAWFPIRDRQQAIAGGLGEFGQIISEHFEQQFNDTSRFARIKQRQPYYIYPNGPNVEEDIISLARKSDNQYVLIGEISELSIERSSRNSFLFWQDAPLSRNFHLELFLFDGNNATLLKQTRMAVNSLWEFELHQQVSPTSQQLWQSQFGQAVTSALVEQSAVIDEALNCLPTYARVLQVSSEQLTVNIGQQDGVQVGDTLTLFKHAQFYDSVGNLHQQLKLHPNNVKVTHVYSDTAVLGSTTSVPLVNIQANDFVARQ